MGSFVPVHLASLKRAVGDLDQGTAWLRVFVMVNVPPDDRWALFTQQRPPTGMSKPLWTEPLSKIAS